jgi:hypothetical protein
LASCIQAFFAGFACDILTSMFLNLSGRINNGKYELLLALTISKISLMGRLYFMLLLIVILSCRKDSIQNEPRGGAEALIYDSIFTTTENDHGFFHFLPRASSGDNWRMPYDFFNGIWYYRFEIIDYPSDTSFMLSLCIWADLTDYGASWKETCCGHVPVSGRGVFTASSVPSSWWLLNEPVDFSRVTDFDRMGLVLWCNDYQNLSDWISSAAECWGGRENLLPMTVRLTIVAVAGDTAFSGWEGYIN